MAVYRVNVAVTAQAENELRRGLDEAGTLLEEYRSDAVRALRARGAARRGPAESEGRARYEGSADRAADRRGVPAAHRLPTCSSSPIRRGRVLAAAGRLRMPARRPRPRRGDRARAGTGNEALSLWPHAGGVIQVVTVPSFARRPELFGTLSVGFSLDEQAAARFKR